MEGFLNFLADNYYYFLIAAGVLTFALIGFIVDAKKKQKNADNYGMDEVTSAGFESAPLEPSTPSGNTFVETENTMMPAETIETFNEDKVETIEPITPVETYDTVTPIVEEPLAPAEPVTSIFGGGMDNSFTNDTLNTPVDNFNELPSDNFNNVSSDTLEFNNALNSVNEPVLNVMPEEGANSGAVDTTERL